MEAQQIIDRIQYLMQKENLTPSSFADKVGVQRSSISHILSGRNKPSLDFILKIESAFDYVSLEWLIKGVEISAPDSPSHVQSVPKENSANETASISEAVTPPREEQKHKTQSSIPEEPVKIVHYYKDGSFESFYKR